MRLQRAGDTATLTRMHGGTIHAENAGEGMLVTIALPL